MFDVCNEIYELKVRLYYLIHSRLFLKGQINLLNWIRYFFSL